MDKVLIGMIKQELAWLKSQLGNLSSDFSNEELNIERRQENVKHSLSQLKKLEVLLDYEEQSNKANE